MKTVLVVDDAPEVAILIKTKLERTQRFAVFTANGGREALRRVMEIKPDIIVSDIDMPDLDGGGLAAELAQNAATRKIPGIFLSSLVTPQDTKRGTPGKWPMLSKQSPIENLIDTIDELLAD